MSVQGASNRRFVGALPGAEGGQSQGREGTWNQLTQVTTLLSSKGTYARGEFRFRTTEKNIFFSSHKRWYSAEVETCRRGINSALHKGNDPSFKHPSHRLELVSPASRELV